jgi:glycosyl transferase family 25
MKALPPVLVISLAGSPRRLRIAERLAGWRGDWSFIDAIDGASLGENVPRTLYDETAAIRKLGRPLSPPEIGCALSHRRAYEFIVRNDLQSAIVLEDDAVIVAEFVDFPFSSVPSGFDIVSLFTLSGLVLRRPLSRIGARGIHRAAGMVRSTVGYLISSKGAKKLIDATRIISAPADWPVHPQDLSFFVVVPNLIGHESGDSDIDAPREELRRRWREKRGLARMLTKGAMANLTIPLFIKYLIERECYVGVADYYRREIEHNMKRMLPIFYSRLGDE